MAIAAIYIILLVTIALIYLGFWKEDYWLIILSSFMLIIIGLFTLNNGFEDITDFTFKWVIGMIFIFTGLYLGVRSGVEAMKEAN
jgi:hypothetical protein